MKRRSVIFMTGGAALGVTLTALAQTPVTARRLGILATGLGSDAANKRFLEVSVFKKLQELGWTVGSNLVVDYRSAEGHYDRLPELAQQLVTLKVDVIFTGGASVNMDAARKVTSTVPLVMAGGYADPVGAGAIQSLARPGGNVTGLASSSDSIPAKRLQLLHQSLPGLSRVGYLVEPGPDAAVIEERLARAARDLKLEWGRYEVRDSAEFEGALLKAKAARVEAMFVAGSPLLGLQHARGLAELLIRYKFPSVAFASNMADLGFLMGYSASLFDVYNRSATYIDKIFHGAKPADLPVEEPTVYELVINLKTAKLLGVKIPQPVLLRADRVIE